MSSPWEASEREGTGTAACLGMSQFVVTRCVLARSGTGACGARCCGAASSEDDRAGTERGVLFPAHPPRHPGGLVATRGRGAGARARRQVVGAIRCSRLLPPMQLLYIVFTPERETKRKWLLSHGGRVVPTATLAAER